MKELFTGEMLEKVMGLCMGLFFILLTVWGGVAIVREIFLLFKG